MEKERTLALIKPDGVKRSLVGKIITRIEDSGLKIVGMKMVWIDEEFAKEHYIWDEEWAKKLFDRTKSYYEYQNKKMKAKDFNEYGRLIQKNNSKFLSESPVIALVIEGPHAIELVRKMIGHTEPRQALPGTIRSDFASIESYSVADGSGRSIKNLMHASDSIDNAKREISLWFDEKELHSYKTVNDAIYSSND